MNYKKITIIFLAIVLPGGLIGFLFWRYLSRNGAIGESGYYDDEGNSEINMNAATNDLTYEQNPVQLQYFKISEFDSPDAPGSGKKMRVSTLLMLDAARGHSEVPYRVNSGVRTEVYNAKLNEVGSVRDSAHIEGYAADIDFKYNDLVTAKKIARGLVKAGFRRLGIYNTPTASFIHADNDPRKKSPVVWSGKGQKPPFDPFRI